MKRPPEYLTPADVPTNVLEPIVIVNDKVSTPASESTIDRVIVGVESAMNVSGGGSVESHTGGLRSTVKVQTSPLVVVLPRESVA